MVNKPVLQCAALHFSLVLQGTQMRLYVQEAAVSEAS